MREFWVASGHHLTRRADHGGLVATPELIMAYLARPELMPPADACEAEQNLHASLLADPLRPVSAADIAALADADARENWAFMMNFRDRLMAAPSLEAVYVALARKGAGDLPPIFLSQLCHLILRNALEGCEDPYVLRAAELFYRSQLAAVHDGTLLLADAEVVEAEQHAQHDLHSSPLTAMLQPKAFGEMDVMDDENAWTYWSRSDAHAMAMNLGGNAKARAGLCRVDRAVDWPSARHHRQRRDDCLDRGSRLALVRRSRQRGDADRQRAVARRAAGRQRRRTHRRPDAPELRGCATGGRPRRQQAGLPHPRHGCGQGCEAEAAKSDRRVAACGGRECRMIGHRTEDRARQ